MTTKFGAAIAGAAWALAGGCASPPPPEVTAAAQQARQMEEMQRLMRLGRFDEARELSRQLDPSTQQTFEQLRRTLPAFGGVELPSLSQMVQMRERFADDEQYVDREPLFVRPLAFGAIAADDGELVRIATLNDHGVVLAEGGDFAGALRAFEAALHVLGDPQAATSRSDKPMLPWVGPRLLSHLGLAHWRLGNTAAALAHFRRALDLRTAWEADSAIYFSERANLTRAEVLAEETDAIVALERSSLAGQPSLGLQVLLERKGSVLERQARSMAAIRQEERATDEWQSRLRAENRELLHEYRQALTERADLERRQPATAEEAQQRQRRIADLERRLRVMQKEIQSRGPREEPQPLEPDPETMRALRRADMGMALARMQAQAQAQERERERRRLQRRAALPADVAKRIPADAALLEMLRYRPPNEPARYALYLLRRQGEAVFIDLGAAEALEGLILELRKQLAYPRSLPQARALGRHLDERLLAPVRRIARDARTLLLAPEGLLNLIPFGALADKDGRFLLERFTFNYLSSGRDLLQFDTPAAPPRSAPLVVADPAFGAAGAVVAGSQVRQV